MGHLEGSFNEIWGGSQVAGSCVTEM